VKYKQILESPDWSEEELSELEGGLKRQVKAWSKAKEHVKARLEWAVSPTALLVTKYLDGYTGYLPTDRELSAIIQTD